MPPPLTFNVTQFRAALDALDNAALGRLQAVARLYAMRTGGRLSPNELLNEAVKRSLEGTRKWSHGVSVEQHLIGAIRSLASHASGTQAALCGPLAEETRDDTAPFDEEETDRVQIDVSRLYSYFEERDDVDAVLVLDELQCRKNMGEIRNSLTLDVTALETIMKRIRRTAVRLGLSQDRRTR